MEYPTHLAPGATQAPNAFPKDCWDAVPGLTPQVKEDLRRIAAGLSAQLEEVEMVEDGREGFEVTESYQLPSLRDVKEDRVLLPSAKGVLVRVDKATTRLGRMTESGNPQSGSVRSLHLQVRLPEGIEVTGENGELTQKYVNKVDFIEVEFAVVKPEARQEERYTGKNQSFLMPLRQLFVALGYDIDNPPAIDDAFLAELVGKTFRVNIGTRPIYVFDDATGKWEATEDKRNTFKQFQVA